MHDLTNLMNCRCLTKCLNISVNDNKFYTPTFCMQVTIVLLRLCVCVGFSLLSLLVDAITTNAFRGNYNVQLMFELFK